MFATQAFSSQPFASESQVLFVLGSVSATASVGTLSVIAKAVTVPTSVSSTVSIGTLIAIAESNTLATSVSATTYLGLTLVVAKANVVPSSVAASFTVGTPVVIARAVKLISSPALSLSIGSTEVTAAALTIPTSVTSTGTIGIITTRTVNRITLVSVPLIGYAGSVDVIANKFDYYSIQDSYERNRTLYLTAQDNVNIVHVLPEPSTIIYLSASDTNRSIKIAA